MSSVPKANVESKNRGVKRIVLKDFQHLDEFADKVVAEVEDMVRKRS